MQAVIELSKIGCLICGAKEHTVKTKVKDIEFAGVLCVKHLLEILRRNDSSRDGAQATGKDKLRAQAEQ